MSEQLVSPQDTYRRLMSEASDSRRKRSLEAINEACQLLHERHSSDFSYKTIITLGNDRGLPVPGEKSIVNKTGEHYRELIQAWKLASLPKANKTKTGPNDWIEHIQTGSAHEREHARQELRALKARRRARLRTVAHQSSLEA